MIRRLGIAQAIMGAPDVLIFDEPTSGLDPEERMRFKSLIAKLDKKRSIIISTHIVEDVEATCDRIIIMDNGHILADATCEEVRQFAEGKVYEVEAGQEGKLQGTFSWKKQLSGTTRPMSGSFCQIAGCSKSERDSGGRIYSKDRGDVISLDTDKRRCFDSWLG